MRKKGSLIALVVSLLFAAIAFSSSVIAAETFKPVTLKFAHMVTENSYVGKHHQWWANEVEKRSGGKIKIQIFWMESLVKGKDMLQGVKSGIADLGYFGVTYFPSNFPLFIVVDNIFNVHQDYVAAILALLETLEKQPDLKAEVEREKMVLVGPYISGSAPIGTKKCFDSIKDLKGKNVRITGGVRTAFYSNLGANPISMPYTDIYEALDRGTIAAFDMGLMISHGFKHYEVVKCCYISNTGSGIGGGIFLNAEVFKNFPKEIQEMLLDLSKEFGVRYAQDLMETEKGIMSEWQTKHGVTIRYPSPEDQKIILEAAEKANEEMLKKQEAAGHKAVRKVWDYYRSALKKYEDQRTKK
jgi:TRAP-type transport system periplasmic protein